MDDLDRRILNTIYEEGGTRATVAKRLSPGTNRAVFQKDYQKIKYRIELMIADQLLKEDDNHKLLLIPEVMYGVLELLDKNGENYKELEMGKTLVVENNGTGTGIIFLEESCKE
jgi:hypothetical protein